MLRITTSWRSSWKSALNRRQRNCAIFAVLGSKLWKNPELNKSNHETDLLCVPYGLSHAWNSSDEKRDETALKIGMLFFCSRSSTRRIIVFTRVQAGNERSIFKAIKISSEIWARERNRLPWHKKQGISKLTSKEDGSWLKFPPTMVRREGYFMT